MKFLPIIVFLALSLLGQGCSQGNEGPGTLHGAWLGEGVFSSPYGQMDVKAQLELLGDNSYRFLVLEPPVLMMAGVEKGDWIFDGDSLELNPQEEPGEEVGDQSASPLQVLRSAPKNFRPKTLSVSPSLKELRLLDDQMDLTFQRNAVATKTLKEKGEI
ncbi:MAG: hypothetical protein JJU11_17130 [Candidatus Sumerlaeia bacterium]|nr:hypothetical protein [Candidatus Sumerlaeia bacterium]